VKKDRFDEDQAAVEGGGVPIAIMPPLAQELRGSRRAVERILKALGVRAFVYTVEQRDAGWVLRIECALDGEWQTVALAVDPGELTASLRDRKLREKLSADWAPHLRACSRRPA
jgi:hypothetical protein